jgi:hypothetical protein
MTKDEMKVVMTELSKAIDYLEKLPDTLGKERLDRATKAHACVEYARFQADSILKDSPFEEGEEAGTWLVLKDLLDLTHIATAGLKAVLRGAEQGKYDVNISQVSTAAAQVALAYQVVARSYSRVV